MENLNLISTKKTLRFNNHFLMVFLFSIIASISFLIVGIMYFVTGNSLNLTMIAGHYVEYSWFFPIFTILISGIILIYSLIYFFSNSNYLSKTQNIKKLKFNMFIAIGAQFIMLMFLFGFSYTESSDTQTFTTFNPISLWIFIFLGVLISAQIILMKYSSVKVFDQIILIDEIPKTNQNQNYNHKQNNSNINQW